VLHDGFISSVTARIPWPNPLTSTLGFSVESLHLTFHLRQKSNTPVHLAASVASVAESFIHEELTPQEEATLLESFHPDLASSIHSGAEYNLPGGLDPDPFLSTPEDDTPNSDIDPDGVSIFAALFERLISRFEFHAVNTKITLVQPGNISLTVSIPEFRYRTEGGGIIANAPREHDITGYKSRNITITGLTVTANSLRVSASKASSLSTVSPRFPNSPSSFIGGPRPLSPSSRSESPAPTSPTSSSEEDMPFEMSQSIAFLPPKHSSPTGSITSSMYQSAISTPSTYLKRGYQYGNDETGPPSASQRQETPQSLSPNDSKSEEQSLDEDVIISFGSHPILIRLGADPLVIASQKPLLPPEKTKSNESLHISVTTGVVACAIQGWHIRAVSDLASFWTANQSKSDSNPSATVSGSQPDVTLTFENLGLVLLVLPPALVASISHQNTCLAEFFKQPLLPSTFARGYLRLFLEAITGSVKSMTRSDETTISPAPRRHTKQRHAAQAIITRISSVELAIGDISLFSIDNNGTPKDDLTLDASPILITDSNLPFQYTSTHHHPDTDNKEEHPHLPTFEIVDQTDEKYRSGGFQPMLWRSKGSQKHNVAERSHMVGSPNPHITAFTLNTTRQENYPHQRKPALEVEVHAVPMHIFVDLGQVLRKEGNWSFLSEAIGDALYSAADESPRSNVGRGLVDHQADTGDSEADTPPASPRSRSARGKQKERQRLENFVLKDLDLDLDYRVKESKAEGQRQRGKGSRKVELCFSALFNISYNSSTASHSPNNFEGFSQD
jgi:autophagy-related protein 2